VQRSAFSLVPGSKAGMFPDQFLLDWITPNTLHVAERSMPDA
jgi:hypothetical protein